MRSLISIIVPVYNVEAWVGRCIDSLLAQTHTDLQILLVDDGSTDRSGEICDRYAEKDSRIRVLHRSNGGVSDARNAGIAAASGDYVTLVDSDDWLHPDFVTHLWRLLDGRTNAISVSRFRRVTKVQPIEAFDADDVSVLSRAEAMSLLVGRLHILLTVAWGKLYPRDLIQGAKFPVGRAVEDEFTTYRIIASADEVVLSNAEYYYYWQRADSLMGSPFTAKRGWDTIDAYRRRAEDLEALGLLDVAREANRHLFRKNMQMYRWLDPADAQRAVALEGMRSILAHSQPGWPTTPFDVFASAYGRYPRLVDPLYSLYLRAVQTFRVRRSASLSGSRMS